MKKLILILSILMCCVAATAQDYIKEGDALFTAGKYAEAKRKYEGYNLINQESPHATRRIGQCDKCMALLNVADYLYSKGNLDEAYAKYSEILDINPSDPTAKARLAAIPKKSAEIEKVWVDYDCFENGVKGMKIHTKFDVYNMLNKQGQCAVYFYTEDGTPLNDANGKYDSTDGKVATHIAFTPVYASSTFSDLAVFMPYDELHCPADRRTDLKFRIIIWDDASNALATSEYTHFWYGTSTSNNLSNNTTDTTQGVTINGVTWATRNVDKPGTFAARPESAGMFYQWNRRKGWAVTGDISGWDNSDALGNKWERANDPCPEGWRVPTASELKSLVEAGSEWTTLSGVTGRRFGYGSNSVFLPAAGYRGCSTGNLNGVGNNGNYWSSEIYDDYDGYYLDFYQTEINPSKTGSRSFVFSVRCVAETTNNGPTDPAAQYELADEYYFANNFTEAVKWYRKAAEQGYAKAQNDLGVMYEFGRGVSQNYAEAAKWYRKAAEQGNAKAQNNLGILYQSGEGVRQDYAEAMKWYRKAADQGNAKSHSDIGELYYYGYGVSIDYAEAVKWYRKAADQGYAFAQYSLGYMYHHGKGVTQSNSEAVKWYRKAAEQGEESAVQALSSMGY